MRFTFALFTFSLFVLTANAEPYVGKVIIEGTAYCEGHPGRRFYEAYLYTIHESDPTKEVLITIQPAVDEDSNFHIVGHFNLSAQPPFERPIVRLWNWCPGAPQSKNLSRIPDEKVSDYVDLGRIKLNE